MAARERGVKSKAELFILFLRPVDKTIPCFNEYLCRLGWINMIFFIFLLPRSQIFLDFC